MKKFFTGLILMLFICTAVSASAYRNILQAVYSPSQNVWSEYSSVEDGIVLVKQPVEGTVNYSEFYYVDGFPAFVANSDFEFISNGILAAVDNAGLKYYKIVYVNNGFQVQSLTDEELRKIFPNVEIIKISQFKDGKITVKKDAFRPKKVLIVDDTDGYYHRFLCKVRAIQDKHIKGLLTLPCIGKYTIVHLGINNQKFTILVR